MRFRNDPLIPDFTYSHLPPMKQDKPSLRGLHQCQQSERRLDLAATIKNDPTNLDITISHSPHFVKSIDDLVALSAAVGAFKRQYDDLRKHIEYIQKAIDSKLNSSGIVLADGLATSPSIHHPSPLPSYPRIDASAETTAAVDEPAAVSQPLPESAETVPEMSKKPEVQILCESMCSRGLRKYIYVNISDRAKLLNEISAALKLAEDPAKLVLECLGKFYLQGRKAFSKDSPMIPARQVSLFILECFLLMPDPGEGERKIRIGSSIKDEAKKAAVTWRRRLVGDGGLAKAEQMDARGLLLLVACFGVPSIFRNLDLLDLIQQSGTAEIINALRRSPFLLPAISDIVDSNIKDGLHIQAVDLIYTFGMEDKFSPSSLLTSFLRTSGEIFERAKRKAQSPVEIKDANEKLLSAFLSVIQCLEVHKLDPSRVLPEWHIKDKMFKLDKETIKLNKEIEEQARSIRLMEDAAVTKRIYDQQIKRQRLSAMEIPLAASSSYSPLHRDRSFTNHRDGGDEISALVSSYLGPPSSFPHRANLMTSSEYVTASAYEHLTNLPPNTSYSPGHGQSIPRQYSPQRRHLRQYSPPIHGQEIPLGRQRIYRQSPSVERYLGLSNHRSPGNSSLDRNRGM